MVEGDRPGPPPPIFCGACGTQVAPGLLSCPGCRRLIHADRLKRLAEEAGRAQAAGDPTAALVAWRGALELLPPETRQYEIISGRIADLGREVDEIPVSARPVSQPAAAGTDPSKAGWASASAAGVGTLALLVWKFKFVALFVLTKAKFLLLGLTKASTFLSMFASLSVYWAAFGWQMGAGLVVSIYIHEMGHVAALLRYGIKASAPLFIPGFGAVIRLGQALHDPRQDARVGLAGPLWGLGAAVGAYAIFLATGLPLWAAIAKLGAVINLFNLMPFWQLDGGRAFHALTRRQRWFAVAVVGTAWLLVAPYTQEGPEQGILILVLLLAAYQAAVGRPAREPDRGALALYVFLVAALSTMLMIPVKI